MLSMASAPVAATDAPITNAEIQTAGVFMMCSSLRWRRKRAPRQVFIRVSA
jgi:hypothetical protein